MAVPTCLGPPTGVHAAHMRDWRTCFDSRRLVTHNAARARGRSGGCGIAVGNPASLAILDAPDFHAALAVMRRMPWARCMGRLVTTMALEVSSDG